MREFRKMHGLGNDFVIIDARTTPFTPDPALIRRIADRRRGVGFDQMMILLPPSHPGADMMLRFFNADGSEAGACGNATRCAAHLLLQETGRDQGLLQTVAGLLPVRRAASCDGHSCYSVDFTTPEFAWDKIPLAKKQDTLRLNLKAGPLQAPCAVNVGNPHAVFFVDDAETIALEKWGPKIERHALFPQRTNVEICQILSPNKIRMRVWERGAGITQACGSGAAATMAAAVRRGLTERKAEIVLDGGSLFFEWQENGPLVMTGPVSEVFTGVFAEKFLTP